MGCMSFFSLFTQWTMEKRGSSSQLTTTIQTTTRRAHGRWLHFSITIISLLFYSLLVVAVYFTGNAYILSWSFIRFPAPDKYLCIKYIRNSLMWYSSILTYILILFMYWYKIEQYNIVNYSGKWKILATYNTRSAYYTTHTSINIFIHASFVPALSHIRVVLAFTF